MSKPGRTAPASHHVSPTASNSLHILYPPSFPFTSPHAHVAEQPYWFHFLSFLYTEPHFCWNLILLFLLLLLSCVKWSAHTVKSSSVQHLDSVHRGNFLEMVWIIKTADISATHRRVARSQTCWQDKEFLWNENAFHANSRVRVPYYCVWKWDHAPALELRMPIVFVPTPWKQSIQHPLLLLPGT